MEKITPTDMYEHGWKPTHRRDGKYEVWVKPDKECLYSRDDQKIVQVRRIKERIH